MRAAAPSPSVVKMRVPLRRILAGSPEAAGPRDLARERGNRGGVKRGRRKPAPAGRPRDSRLRAIHADLEPTVHDRVWCGAFGSAVGKSKPEFRHGSREPSARRDSGEAFGGREAPESFQERSGFADEKSAPPADGDGRREVHAASLGLAAPQREPLLEALPAGRETARRGALRGIWRWCRGG